jgi:hypothetical protein
MVAATREWLYLPWTPRSGKATPKDLSGPPVRAPEQIAPYYALKRDSRFNMIHLGFAASSPTPDLAVRQLLNLGNLA